MSRVFISYSHDSADHKDRVDGLAARLRQDGVDIVFDRDCGPGGPPEGWPVWSETQVREAEKVLVAVTQAYCRRYEARETPGSGLGAVCEARAIRQELYDSGGHNEKFRVVLLRADDSEHVPAQLKGYHRFDLFSQQGYSELRAWLGVPGDGGGPENGGGSIDWPPEDPDFVCELANRKEEFDALRRMLAGDSNRRILLLRGPTNSGKTALLSELSRYAHQVGVEVAHLNFKGCPSLSDIFEMVLLDLGPETLGGTHRANGTARFHQLIADLQKLKAPLLLIFDTYEDASDDANRWLEGQLLARLDRAPGVVVVIGGQKTPDPSKHRWEGLSRFHEVPPITRIEDWMEFSSRKWNCPELERAHVEALTLTTDGDPGQVRALLEAMVRKLQSGSAAQERR